MGGRWRHRADTPRHRRVRASLLAAYKPGQPCARCGHPLMLGDKMDADHDDLTDAYLGLSHSSPCRTCGKRCNQSAGGIQGALRQGKQLREDRICPIDGTPYSGGASTCGAQACITELRRIRRGRHPLPDPPAASGRAW